MCKNTLLDEGPSITTEQRRMATHAKITVHAITKVDVELHLVPYSTHSNGAALRTSEAINCTQRSPTGRTFSQDYNTSSEHLYTQTDRQCIPVGFKPLTFKVLQTRMKASESSNIAPLVLSVQRSLGSCCFHLHCVRLPKDLIPKNLPMPPMFTFRGHVPGDNATPAGGVIKYGSCKKHRYSAYLCPSCNIRITHTVINIPPPQ